MYRTYNRTESKREGESGGEGDDVVEECDGEGGSGVCSNTARRAVDEAEENDQARALLAALREEKRGSFVERKGGARLANYEEEGGGADGGNDDYAASYETAYEGL